MVSLALLSSVRGSICVITPGCCVCFRELLEVQHSQWAQLAGVQDQLSTVGPSVQEQSSAVQSLQSELRAQLENLQKQVAQVASLEPAHSVLMFQWKRLGKDQAYTNVG